MLSRPSRADPQLRERFAGARMTSVPRCSGRWRWTPTAAGVPGLLLAGDAAGFIDPMTGDGLRFAVRGGELAARSGTARRSPGTRRRRTSAWRGARRREFAAKWRFNRALRRLVGAPRHRGTAPRAVARGRRRGCCAATIALCRRRPAIDDRPSSVLLIVCHPDAGREPRSRRGTIVRCARRARSSRLAMCIALMQVAYPASFAAMLAEGLWRGVQADGLIAAGALVFVVGQGAEVLGDRHARPAVDVPGARAAGIARDVSGGPVPLARAPELHRRRRTSCWASRWRCTPRSPARSRSPGSAC